MAQKDKGEKVLEAYPDVFADIGNVLIFGGKNVIHEDELESCDTVSVYKEDGKLRKQIRDVAKYCKQEFMGLPHGHVR